MATCGKSVEQMLDAPIEELLETPISVASNVSLDPKKQPASVTVITREQLQLSAARTLNEALMTYIPGYFIIEGHSDTVGAFRGLAADSNAKIMMLINGHNINAERYGGMPDGIINGTNFDWIERIEVVRGSGSVTLGQGALQGVVNIITRTADNLAPECGDAKVTLLGGGGLNNAWQGGMEAAFNREDSDGYVFVQQKNYDGQPLRREGWAAKAPLFGDSAPGEGGVLADVGHHLKRTDNLSVFGHLRYGQLSFDVLHVDQTRDMYFFGRDSDGVGEGLNYFGLNHNFDFTKDINLESKLDVAIDDASQYTVQTGSTAGGNREIRYGIKEVLHLNNLWEGNNLALGSEAHLYELGLNNSNGANFIINNMSQLNGETINSLNKKNAFVFPANIDIYSFFIEDNYEINKWLTLFGGLRFDEHQYWGEHFSPRAGAFITPWQDGVFRLSYQEGIRGAVGLAYSGGYIGDGFLSIPNLGKLGSANIPGYGNMSVKPEVLKTFELAFNQRLNKNWQFENVLFYSKALHVIDVDAVGGDDFGITLPPVGSDVPGYNWYWFYMNKAGSSEQFGFESSVHYVAEPFNITASHSFVDALSYTGQTAGGQTQLPGVAPNVSRLNVVFKPWEKVSLGANYLFYNSWNSPNGTQADGAHLLNASVIYSPWKQLELSASVKNILGENSLYPMLNYLPDIKPGAPALESTTFWLNFRFSFEGKI
jgi:outer membrane receptor protein involved in Fe transport